MKIVITNKYDYLTMLCFVLYWISSNLYFYIQHSISPWTVFKTLLQVLV